MAIDSCQNRVSIDHCNKTYHGLNIYNSFSAIKTQSQALSVQLFVIYTKLLDKYRSDW